MLNNIQIIGRLAKDPELQTNTRGVSHLSFTLVVPKRIKPVKEGEKDADFFNIKAWDKTAEYIANYLGKGRLTVVTGRMESRKYTDKEGVNREIWEVIADRVTALDRSHDVQHV